ncbi:hypothetical protein RWE15_12820 [Virgibacillus halophilus]|uniref:Uncharacterized protein n=1 Tax=Tigheibacillus halophilus TaxID=361280 RepID=A0ABU5C7V8_9BACI|nr:hypothetical protein [Virgibacillus halophilus]
MPKLIRKLAGKQFAVGNETIGIICKTMRECEEYYQQLKHDCAVSLITPKLPVLKKGC